MATRTPSPLQILASKLPKPLRNKYFIALAVFFALMTFADSHDILTQVQLKNSIDRLEHDKVYYEVKIREALVDHQNIQTNTETFVREKYHMHKPNEEVFVIEKN